MSKTRLQLLWPNKDKKLLTHGVDTYEWVDPKDWRATEVRLLEHVQDVGDPATGNLVIHGDALHALSSLTQLPELRAEFLGKVKLCYIDPPFNTKQAFAHYNDAVEHSVWLTMMRDRIVQIRQLLSDEGSVWVHLDDAEAHRMRSVMDEVMGAENFVATIVWEKDKGRRNDTDVSSVHDYLLVYAKSKPRWKRVRNLLPRTDKQDSRYRNPDNDPRGPWLQGDNGTAKSGTEDARFEVVLPSGRRVRPPAGNYWRFSAQKLEEARSEGRVWFGVDGDSMPVIKRYRDSVQDGLVPRTWWPGDEAGTNQDAKRDHLRKLLPDREPFSTPKPEALLQRVLTIATNPGDIVLDCFAGSATTAAVSMKMGRRFVTSELVEDTLARYVIPRLEKVVNGEDPGGISNSTRKVPAADLPDGVGVGQVKAAHDTLKALIEHGTWNGNLDSKAAEAVRKALSAASRSTTIPAGTGWQGGSGFRVLRVAESMFVTDDDDDLYLAEWMHDEDLDRAVCAQMRYSYEPAGPFAGRKGASRLAVLDAMATEGTIRLLIDALDEAETVLVVAQAIGEGVEQLLRELRKGSKVRKMPNDLARAGVLPSQVVRIFGGTDGGDT